MEFYVWDIFSCWSFFVGVLRYTYFTLYNLKFFLLSSSLYVYVTSISRFVSFVLFSLHIR